MLWLALISCALAVAVSATGSVAATPASMRSVIVTLKSHSGLGGLGGSRADRVREIVRRRRAIADAGYDALRPRLESWRRRGDVSRIRRLWIVNGFAMDASPAVARALEADPAVAAVTPDIAPIEPAAAAATPEWNLALIGAPAAWGAGVDGTGVVVATLDSGVDMSHPDIAARWRGGIGGWFDPFGQHPTVPTDLTGHGTLVMGVIVGGGDGGTSIGTAPGAQWIAARIFDDMGGSSTSAIHQAFQWVLDPDGNPATDDAPQVVNASWSFSSPGCNLTFAPDIQALRAAGILPVFAAGNFGAASASPANNPGAFAVGSTTATDAIASDSSRGPSACGEPSATFPEVVAPGVSIRTADLAGQFATASGTSLAAPHVAGALALLLDAHPGLSVAEQEAAIEQTAIDLGPTGPDDTFGYGRIDVSAALQWIAPSPPTDTVGPVVTAAIASPEVTSTAPVTLAAAATDAAGATTAAEWFADTDPGVGHGAPMSAADGAFDAATESLTATIDPSGLAPGSHSIGARARDDTGNWGATTTTTLIVDRTGPVVAALTIGPNPTNLRRPGRFDAPAANTSGIALSATAVDDHVAVSAAEWFEGGDPGAGNAIPVTVTGGNLTARIDLLGQGWLDGPLVISVRARDALGNWGAPTRATVTIVRPNVIFRDAFASGDGSAWSAIHGARRLTFAAVRPGASMRGSMRVRLSGRIRLSTPASAFVTDDSPRAEAAYAASFTLNPNASTPGGGARGITILSASALDGGRGTRRFAVDFRRRGSARQVRLRVARRGGVARTRWVTIPPRRSTRIEVTWRAGTRTTATLRVAGRSVQRLRRLNTGRASRIESVRLGALGLRGRSTSRVGSIFLGRFVSARYTVGSRG